MAAVGAPEAIEAPSAKKAEDRSSVITRERSRFSRGHLIAGIDLPGGFSAKAGCPSLFFA